MLITLGPSVMDFFWYSPINTRQCQAVYDDKDLIASKHMVHYWLFKHNAIARQA
jgi:hypothetical protein